VGHADIKATMKYTHSVTEEERRVSEQLGDFLSLENGSKINPGFPKSPALPFRTDLSDLKNWGGRWDLNPPTYP